MILNPRPDNKLSECQEKAEHITMQLQEVKIVSNLENSAIFIYLL